MLEIVVLVVPGKTVLVVLVLDCARATLSHFAIRMLLVLSDDDGDALSLARVLKIRRLKFDTQKIG